MIVPLVSQLRKLRLRDGKQHAQSYTARKGQSQSGNLEWDPWPPHLPLILGHINCRL